VDKNTFINSEAMASSFEEKNLQTLLEKIANEEGFENPR